MTRATVALDRISRLNEAPRKKKGHLARLTLAGDGGDPWQKVACKRHARDAGSKSKFLERVAKEEEKGQGEEEEVNALGERPKRTKRTTTRGRKPGKVSTVEAE